jgi:basic membrane protein A
MFVAFLPVVAKASSSDKTNRFRIGMVFDKGGRDDRSFNAAAWQGLQEAKGKLGVDVKFVEAMDDNAYEPALRTFARKNFNLIIAIGFSQAEPVARAARDFPGVHFALVDAVVDLPNVRSLIFADHEGAFIAGAAARLKSRTGKVGFLGGMDVPLIRRFDMGFKAGARHVDLRSSPLSNFVGVTVDSWNNPPKAKELALSQFANGVDVIYVAAGASAAGAFDAAAEKGVFAIGTDSNQNGQKPGRILTSILKRIDVAIYQTIDDALGGRFSGGKREFGVANGGIDYAVDRFNDKLMDLDTRKKLDQIKSEIASGSIKVPDFYLVGGSRK